MKISIVLQDREPRGRRYDGYIEIDVQELVKAISEAMFEESMNMMDDFLGDDEE